MIETKPAVLAGMGGLLAFLVSLSTIEAAVTFPRQAISLGVPCINPDRTRGTCEAYSQCASFSVRAYIRGETGVCGFMPNGDPAVCCQVVTNVGSSLSEDDNNNNNGGRNDQKGASANNANQQQGSANKRPPPSNNQAPPPTFVIPGVNVGFDPEFGDLASRIRGAGGKN